MTVRRIAGASHAAAGSAAYARADVNPARWPASASRAIWHDASLFGVSSTASNARRMRAKLKFLLRHIGYR
jgi:hypothetical protein